MGLGRWVREFFLGGAKGDVLEALREWTRWTEWTGGAEWVEAGVKSGLGWGGAGGRFRAAGRFHA